MAGLIDAGIRHVINLMEEDERDHDGDLFTPYQDRFRQIASARHIDVQWERVPVRDVSVPSRQVMTGILDMIDRAMAQNRPVYVHCWGGKGRTGTVVGCYLIRHGHAGGAGALEKIKDLRRNDPRSHEPSRKPGSSGILSGNGYRDNNQEVNRWKTWIDITAVF